MNDRTTIKNTAKEILRRYWGPCIGVLVLYSVLVSVVGALSFGIGDLFLMPPLLIGLSIFFINVWRREGPPFETLFSGFQRYAQSLIGILWMYLWTFLWSLLFIIPGIVKSYAYSMTPYLLADYPDIDPRQALKVSMAITKGRKAEIFIMQLSFLGWILLSGFTLGILYIVYVGPYYQISMAGLYQTLLEDALEEGAITPEDLTGWSATHSY